VLILGTDDATELALGLAFCALLAVITLTDLERRVIPNTVLGMGAIAAVAISEALTHGAEATVLAVIPERGDRYLAQFYRRQWLADLGYVTEMDVDTWTEACGRLSPLDPADWRDRAP
jgi:hypothetical protein